MKDGFLLINKEPSWTSRDVCNKIMHNFHLDKVGHNGTLDPFASGLLLVACGMATRTLLFIENCTKTYVAKLNFGKKTSTGDLTGETVEEKQVSKIDEEIVDKVFASLLGPQKQIPPMTSAVHFQGRKLYQLAHEGKNVDRPARDIYIHDLKLLDLNNESLTFEATVSKGTYIRTLGETIAEKLNNVGYLETLHRTKIGSIDVNDSKQLNEVTENDFIPILDVVKDYMPILSFSDEETILKIKHGGKLSLKLFPNKERVVCLTDSENNPLAIYSLKENEYYYCARNLN